MQCTVYCSSKRINGLPKVTQLVGKCWWRGGARRAEILVQHSVLSPYASCHGFSEYRLILSDNTWAPITVAFFNFICAELSVNMHVLKVKGPRDCLYWTSTLKFPDFCAIKIYALSISAMWFIYRVGFRFTCTGSAFGCCVFWQRLFISNPFWFPVAFWIGIMTCNRNTRKPVLNGVARLRPCRLKKAKKHTLLYSHIWMAVWVRNWLY